MFSDDDGSSARVGVRIGDSVLDLARALARLPLAAIVYTDIGCDGMMQGANVEAMVEMTAAVPIPVIASGGVTSLDDVRRLATAGLAGCIVGRALYEGKLRLREIAATIAGI